MKNTTHAWGWLTAGVLALGLNGIYHDVGAQWAHRVFAETGYYADAALAPLSGQVDQLLAKANMTAARIPSQSCRRAAAAARIQASDARVDTDWAQVEALSAREEAQLAKLEANRARIEAQVARAQFANIAFNSMEFSAPRVHVNCPRVRLVVPHLPMLMKPAPVHVETTSAGPI